MLTNLLPFAHSRWRSIALLLTLLAMLTGTAPVHARTEAQADPPVTASLVADQSGVSAGGRVQIALRLQHAPGWHTYWRNPGDSGLATELDIRTPEGARVEPLQWPLPKRFLLPPLANFGYDEAVLLARTVHLPEQIESNTVTFKAQAAWLVCRDICLPGQAALSLTLPVLPAGQIQASGDQPAFEAARRQLPAAKVDVDTTIIENRLALILPPGLVGGMPERVEFFPLETGYLDQPAPQHFYRLPDGAGWRLEIPLAADVETARQDDADWLKTAAAGVLVIDSQRAIQLEASQASPMPRSEHFAGGQLVATVRGHASNEAPAIANPNTDASATVSTANGSPQSEDRLAPAILLAMLSAALGGLILNLMPCVFPVIGLKILGFAGHGVSSDGMLSQRQRRAVRTGSLWFAAGILAMFLILASAMLAMQAAGQAVGWGFQLQSPTFVALMALLFVGIGLNFSGLYEMGTTLTRLGSVERNLLESETGDGHDGVRAWPALGSGALAVLVATPCTAPFMGSALGFTMTQSAGTTLLVFISLGLGMALPYMVLGVFPGWLRLLPRPGRWMETLRQMMAFPMYGAAAWLAWVLGRQAGVDAMLALLAGAVILGFALWIWGRHGQTSTSRPGRLTAGAVSLALLVVSINISWQEKSTASQWQAWNRQSLTDSVAAEKPVFVDFTAAWCISCQVNKKTTLQQAAVEAAFKERGVVLMRADWTSQNAAITEELARHGRNGVPLYLLYRPGSARPEILPALLTPDIMMDALASLAKPL